MFGNHTDTKVDSGAGLSASPAPDKWSRYGNSPYLIGRRIAAGGMGTVHLGLKQGALGFRRLLAVKRLHTHLAQDPDFVARFMDEIRLVSQLNHPNVIQTLDVLEVAGELALVMEFIEGLTLHELLKDGASANIKVPIPVGVGIVAQALHGLHCAHEMQDKSGHNLNLVHRDVSPQNLMIGRDGLVKVLDFGVAKANTEAHVTRTGQLSGKASYMSPEQIWGKSVDRRTDIFAAGVVLWETLTGSRLFRPAGTAEAVALRNVLDMKVTGPSELRPEVTPALERIVLRALERDPSRRYGSARDFALALEEAVPEASVSAIASGIAEVSGSRLRQSGETAKALKAAVSDADPEVTAIFQRSAELDEALTQPAPLFMSAPSAAGPHHVKLSAASSQTNPPRHVLDPSSPPPLRPRLLLLAPLVLLLLTGAWLGLSSSETSALVESTNAKLPKQTPLQHEQTPSTEKSSSSVVESSDADEPNSKPASPAIASSNALLPDSLPKEKGLPGAVAQSTASKPDEPRKREPRSGSYPAPTRNKGRANASRPRVTPSPQTGNGSKPSPSPVPKEKVPSCSPPTYTDAEGIRHFKPECL